MLGVVAHAIKNEFNFERNEMLTRVVPHPMIGRRQRAPAALTLRMK
jgi:hypothetical protein